MPKYLIVIGGATATGKTRTAIELAQHFNSEIISADSRQFFREMSIGTAKPTKEELSQANHHLINSLSVEEEYSVGDFERDTLNILEKLYAENDVAILVGGSGLYIRAICEGLDEFPQISLDIRNQLDEELRQNGIQFLQKELQEKDPEYYKKVDLKNPVRLTRALSVIRQSGLPFSSFLNRKKPPRPFIPIFILLEMPREKLYERINLRVDKMMEEGLLEEAKSLYKFKNKTSLQTVGYQEFMKYFDNEWSLQKAIEMVKQNSRRYAKRQMTWFRKRPCWTAFCPDDFEKIKSFAESKMED